MTKKFLLALIFILSVASISFAATATRTPGVYEVPSTIEIPDPDDPDADPTEFELNSIADAIDFANNQEEEPPASVTITLVSGYDITGDEELDTSDFNGIVRINGSVPTVTDARHYTINGGQIVFSNVSFNGNGTGGGVVINSGAEVSFDNGTRFNRNYASELDDPRGGALYIYDGGTVNLGNCTFSNNTAHAGGAIFNAGTLNFNGSASFSNNTADGEEPDPDADPDDDDDSYPGYGGAIYSTKELNINNGTFSSNRGLMGAAVYATANITINGGTFTSNGTNSTITTTNGGVAYCTGTLTVNGGTFSSNTATNGGVISGANLAVNGGTFSQNNADLGGAVYSTSSMTIGAGTFSNNTANQGGAVYASAAITVNNGTFSGNTATRGGAILSTTTVTISGGTFDKNSATGTTAFDPEDTDVDGDGGGAVYANSIVVNGDAVFTSNTADEEAGSGGALCSLSNLNISAGTFGETSQNGNSAKDGGAGFAKASATISGGSFNYNKAGIADEGNGGAIYAGNNITVTGGTFTGNNVNGSTENHFGGALYAGTNVTLNGTMLFKENIADNGFGGAIYAERRISNTTGLPMFQGNEAHAGGAVYSPYTGTGSNYAVSMVNASFDKNLSTTTGGAVHTEGIANFSNSTFTANEAGTFGGGIYANGHVIIFECTFGGSGTTSGLGNIAAASGGGIYTQGSGTSYIQNSAFVQNSALRGGAVALSSPPTAGTPTTDLHTILVQRCYFGSNTATNEGGALRLDGYSSQVLQCTFEENRNTTGATTLEGGAAYLASQRIVTANCTFYNNSAPSSTGGALHITSAGSQSFAAILMNTFVGNKVGSGMGGGIYLDRSTGMTMFGNLMVNNTAGTASGKDVFVNSGVISSGGYNILTDFGLMSSGRPSSFSWYISPSVTGDAELDSFDADYLTGDFFTTPISKANASYNVGANTGYSLWVLALRPSTDEAPNIALGFASGVASRQYFNNYGLEYVDGIDNSRPSSHRWDTGAHQLSTKIGEGGDDDDDDTGYLTKIKISGLPATLCYVGQTTSLVVKGYDQANRLLGNVAVTWSVNPGGYIEIDDNTGNIYIYRATADNAYVTITATAANGLTASTRLYIREDDATGTNLAPKIWNIIYEYIKDSESKLTVDTSTTTASIASETFQSEFTNLWSSTGQLATISDNDDFELTSNPSTITNSDGDTSVKSGVEVFVSGCSEGDILPLVYSWSFDEDNIAQLTWSSGTANASIATTMDTFKNVFTAAFQDYNGKNIPVIGSGGVSFEDAVNAGAFYVQENSGSVTGLTFYLKAYIANVAANTNSQLVTIDDGSKILIVPDGLSDENIAGSMFLLKKANTSGASDSNPTTPSDNDNNKNSKDEGSGGGGGGGCNLNFAGMLGICLLAVFIKRR